MTSVVPLTQWHLAAELDGSTVLSFTGGTRADTSDNLVIGQELAAMVDSNAKGNVYLDFENVEYLYSADLGKLVGIWKKLANDGRKLALFNVKPHVHEVFQVTRLDKLLEIR